MHVWDDDRFAFRRARAAYTLTDLDSYTRRSALKRAEHEFTVFCKVESCPIHIRQRMEDQGREIRRVRDQIAFTGEQSWIVAPRVDRKVRAFDSGRVAISNKLTTEDTEKAVIQFASAP